MGPAWHLIKQEETVRAVTKWLWRAPEAPLMAWVDRGVGAPWSSADCQLQPSPAAMASTNTRPDSWFWSSTTSLGVSLEKLHLLSGAVFSAAHVRAPRPSVRCALGSHGRSHQVCRSGPEARS